jgi:hypothetical protein
MNGRRVLFVFCEGWTESTFVDNVMAPHFARSAAASVSSLVLPSRRNVTNRAGKGGWNSYAKAKMFIQQTMQKHHRIGTWFTTMLDYYGLPTDFPKPCQQSASPRDQVRALELVFRNDVIEDKFYRFTPYLQLHEFEALLLADIDQLRQAFPDQDQAIDDLKRELAGLQPEQVDGGATTHPSRRIINHLPQYDGRKASAGPQTAAHIGLDRLRQACPHFGDWITELESKISD